MSIERDHLALHTEPAAADRHAAVHGRSSASEDAADSADAVLALVGLDPVALLCTFDVLTGDRSC